MNPALKGLSVTDMMILLQRELFGEDWHHIFADGLTKNFDSFEIERVDKTEDNKDQGNTKGLSGFVKDPELTLMEWKRYQRLTFHERLHILKKFTKEGSSIKQICSEYCINVETIKRIINEFRNHKVRWNNPLPKTCRQMKASQKLIEEVAEFCKTSDHPFVTGDLSIFIKNKWRVNIPTHVIRETMKKELRLSFKKGKSRPFKLDFIKQNYTKSLFAVKIIKKLDKFSTLINIDETLFSRQTKITHSWLLKGKEWTVKNIWSSNSWSVITAITSTGSVYALCFCCSITGKIFAEFLKELNKFIKNKLLISSKDWLIFMDNASTHRSSIVKEVIKQEKLNVAFIPAYSPELAPIEKYFSLLKKTTIKETQGSFINWKNEKSLNEIDKSIQKIPSIVVVHIWRHLMHELRNILDFIFNLI